MHKISRLSSENRNQEASFFSSTHKNASEAYLLTEVAIKKKHRDGNGSHLHVRAIRNFYCRGFFQPLRFVAAASNRLI